MNAAVIICAAGASTRFGGKQKKIFEKVCGTVVFLRSINIFAEIEDFKQIILAVAQDDLEKIKLNWEANLSFSGVEICLGGKSRFETVQNALAVVRDDIDIVAVHDAARCCTQTNWINEALSKCEEKGAAILASSVVSTLKKVEGQVITDTVDRSNLYEAQTPQVFDKQILLQAYKNIVDSGVDTLTITDDCSAVEKLGKPISIVETDCSNIKITNKTDLAIAEAIIKSQEKPSSRGFHPFADENMLRL